MEASVLPPKQYSQSSRKGKKAWRKHVDIEQVQEGLDDLRQELIEGGVIAEKPSDQLFLTDTIGSTEIKRNFVKKHKLLKADEILARRSAVPAVSTHKRSADSMVTDGIIAPVVKKARISHKEYEKLRKIAYGGDTTFKDVVKTGEDATYDPWSVVESARLAQFSFLEAHKPVREPATLKHAPISQLKSRKAVPAVSAPAAGKSYNPTFGDWQDVLQRAGEKEVEAEKQRLVEARREEARIAMIEKAQAEAAEREALGEWETEGESDWEGFQSEPEAEWMNRKLPTRKTQTERNKIQRLKDEKLQKIHVAKMKAREQQTMRIKALASEVEREQTLHRMQLEKRNETNSSEYDSDEELAKRRGRALIPEAPLEVVLPEELQDSLRLLKPEGNLLTDRFRNMLLRGKMETRRKIAAHKKRRVQFTEKWTFKDWKLK